MNMDHVPELWKELRLEFKDNLWKKYEELYVSLLEEDEPINKLNTIRTRKLNLGGTGLCPIVKKPDEIVRDKNSDGIFNEPENIAKTKSEKKGKNTLKKLHCIIC